MLRMIIARDNIFVNRRSNDMVPRLYQKLSGKNNVVGRNSEEPVLETAPKVKDML